MAKIKLKNLSDEDKYAIINAVTAAAGKLALKGMMQKDENYEDIQGLMHGRRIQLGELVFDTALTAAEKRLLKARSAWFKHTDEIQFIAWDGTRKHKFNLPMAETRPLPCYLIRDSWNGAPDENKPVYFDALSAVSIAVRELETYEQQYATEIHKIDQEIKSVLAGRVNAQQAMERWPGLEKVYPEIKNLVVEASQQLVVITDTLDRTFAAA